jgi:enoyl-CoA hydratase/carnithine racemase
LDTICETKDGNFKVDQGRVEFTKNSNYGIIEIISPTRELSDSMEGDLRDICAGIAWDDNVHVMVLAFDGELTGTAALTGSASTVQIVADMKIPTIAAVKGNCVDFGLELALGCDIRIGLEGAQFGFPGIQAGLIPCAGGTQRLPRLIGRDKALEMILSGGLMDSKEALSSGLMSRLAAKDDFDRMIQNLVEEMASKSPLALSFVKEALYKGQDMGLDQGLRMELDLYLLLFTTDDRIEGITAFKEKRVPQFKGQ